MKQFNGKYGCSYCLHKGEQVQVGRGTARVYAFNKVKLRTSRTYKTPVSLAIHSGMVVKGIKGPSITSLIPEFDIIESFAPDYMHSCLLRISKLFISAWFDSKNNDKSYYLGPNINEFNKRLMAIYSPTEVTRVPRPVTEKCKANKWKNFVLYYSIPCLKNLLPEKYLKHWLLFVFSLYTFSKESIADAEFKLAKSAFQKFVENVEDLYGITYLKFNVHRLLHIPRFVRNYGNLWAWSAFPFENFNGVMKKVFHGTQYIPHQICKAFQRLRYIKNNSNVFDNDNCSAKTLKLFLKLMNECRKKLH